MLNRKITHKMIFDETIERLSTITTPIDWMQEQENFIAAHPKAWRDRKFFMRFHTLHLSRDLVVSHTDNNKNWKYYCYTDSEKANRCLILFKLLLADKHKFTRDCNVTHVERKLFPYQFRMSEKQQNHLLELLKPDDLLVKSIRMDKNCFFHDFIKTITPSTVNHEHPSLRLAPHLPYTVYGHGVADRILKKDNWKESPYVKTNQVADEAKLKKLKDKTSRHQSCSLITKKAQPPVFGHTALRKNKLAGFVFNAHDAAWNRLFIYDSGTISRPYEHETIESAKSYYETKVKSANPVLFSDMDSFKKAISTSINKDKHNEVLARLRFDINTTTVGIFQDSIESRCIAQYFAAIMRRRLEEQYQEKELMLDANYQVPIVYYLPNNPKNNLIYSFSEQQADRKFADLVAADPTKLKAEFDAESYEFLYLISNPDDIFNIKYKKMPIIVWLVYQGLLNLAEDIFKRTSHYTNRASYLHYLNGKCTHPLTRFPDGNSLLHVLAKCDQADMLPVFSNESILLNLNEKNNGNKTPFDVAIHYQARNMPDALKKIEKNASLLKSIKQSGDIILQKAVDTGNIDSIQEIVDLKPTNVNVINSLGESPLHFACQSGRVDMLTTLITLKANVNAQNIFGDTPLIYSSKFGNIDFVNQLIEANANLNLTDAYNNTALHFACCREDIKMVETLIAAGATLNIINEDGKTPFDLAVEPKKTELATTFALATINHLLSTLPKPASNYSLSLFSSSGTNYITEDKIAVLNRIELFIKSDKQFEESMMAVLHSDPQLSILAAELTKYLPNFMPNQPAPPISLSSPQA